MYSICVYFVSGKLLVVTEFCPGGNLRNFLRSSRVDYQNLTPSLNDRQLLKIALDVVSGMVHLSHHKVRQAASWSDKSSGHKNAVLLDFL